MAERIHEHRQEQVIESSTFERHAEELYDALAELLAAPDLHLGNLDDKTCTSINKAWYTMERYESLGQTPTVTLAEYSGDDDPPQQALRRFRVRYARVVIMEVSVDAESADHVTDDGRFPGVYDHLPTNRVPAHVEGIVDYDVIWEIEEDEETASHEVAVVHVTESGERDMFDAVPWLEQVTDEQLLELRSSNYRLWYCEMIPGQAHCPSGEMLYNRSDVERWIAKHRPYLVVPSQ